MESGRHRVGGGAFQVMRCDADALAMATKPFNRMDFICMHMQQVTLLGSSLARPRGQDGMSLHGGHKLSYNEHSANIAVSNKWPCE